MSEQQKNETEESEQESSLIENLTSLSDSVLGWVTTFKSDDTTTTTTTTTTTPEPEATGLSADIAGAPIWVWLAGAIGLGFLVSRKND